MNNLLLKKCSITTDEVGTIHYRINGRISRKDGPAIVFSVGRKEWYLDGLRHRIDGPAIEDPDYIAWFMDGKRHCLTGPAIHYYFGPAEDYWYIDGVKYSEVAFRAAIAKRH